MVTRRRRSRVTGSLKVENGSKADAFETHRIG